MDKKLSARFRSTTLSIMRKLINIVLYVVTLMPIFALANVEIIDYKVNCFQEFDDSHYLIILKELNNSETEYRIHIKFRPKCYSRMDYGTSVSEERAIFEEATALVHKKLQNSSIIALGRKSGTGFLPLSENGREYIAESLRLLKSENSVIPYFQHHDLGWGLCKN